MAIQGPIDLKGIVEEQMLKQLIQEVKESQTTQIEFKNINALSAELKEKLLMELENIASLTNITLGELPEEHLNSAQLKKRIHDLEVRNQLLSLYGIEKTSNPNLWQALIQAHFYQNIDPSGRYRLFKRMESKEDQDTLQDAISKLGATWHHHLLAYLQVNKDSFEIIGFPYREFIAGMMSDVPFYPAEQLKAFNEHLLAEDPYMPFKQVSIEYTRLDPDNEMGAFKTEILNFIENNANQGSPVDTLKLECLGSDPVYREKNNAQIADIIDSVLEAVKARNAMADKPTFRVQIYINAEKLDAESSKKLREIQNLIAQNQRAFQKSERAQADHVKAEPRTPPKQVLRAGKVDPSLIRQCKRNPNEILAGLDVEVQMQQQQQQQQQQQEQQQMQMMQQRQSMLDELMKRKNGQGNYEEADAKAYLNGEQFIAAYQHSRAATYLGPLYNTDPSIGLEQLWQNMTGSKSTFPGKIMGLSKSAAELLIAFPAVFSDGFNIHNLPPGFVIKQAQGNPKHLLIDYDPVRAKLDLRSKNDLQITFIPRAITSRQILPGDERQFGLTEQEYLDITTEIYKNRIDILRELIIRQLPKEIMDEYKDEVPKFKSEKLLKVIVDCIENKSIEDLLAILQNTKDRGQVYLDELVNEPIGIDQTQYDNFIDKLSTTEKCHALNTLMKNEDEELGPIIERQYGDLIKLFDKQAGVLGLAQIVFKEGTQGVKILLDKLDAIRDKHGDKQLQSFLNIFVSNNINSPLRLVQSEQLKALDFVAGLSKGQYAWWQALTEQQAKCDEDMDIVELAKGFNHFIEKLSLINPNLQLTDPCPIQNVKNMKVALDRVWYIVNNAVDPKEQMDHLEGLPLGPLDAYLAMQAHDFFIVTPEMNLKAQGSFLGSNAFISLDPDNPATEPYGVHLNEFGHVASEQVDYQDCRMQFYRLLGKQPFLDQFDKYTAVVALIDQRYDLQKRNMNSFGSKLDEAIAGVKIGKGDIGKAFVLMGEESKPQADPKIALALVAYATSHKEALGTIDKNTMDKLFDALNKIELQSKQAKKNLYSSLLSHISLGGDPPKSEAVINPPTLAQLTSLVAFHHDLGAQHTFNKGNIEQALTLSGKYFYVVLEELNKARQKDISVLTAANMAEVLVNFSEDAALKKDEHRDVRELLLKTFARVSGENFNEDNLQQFIGLCGRFADSDKDKSKLLNIIELINSVDVMHQNTTAIPSVTQLTDALHVTMSLEDGNPAALLRKLSTLPGFEHCYFGSQKVEEFDPDSIKDFLKEAEAGIREQLGGFIDFKDEDFADPVLFIKKLKDFEDRIPSMILKPLLGKAFSMVKGSHDAVIMQHLEEHLWKGEDKMQNITAAIFNDKLSPVAKPQNLSELLILSETMGARLEDVDKLIDIFNTVKMRSYTDYEKLVTLLNDSPGVSQVPMPILYDILDQMNRFHKGKLSIDLIAALVTSASVKKDTIANWNDAKRWLLPLYREKQVSTNDLGAMIELGLNLSAKQINADSLVKLMNFIVKQGNFRKDFIKIFSDMEANPEFSNQFNQMITNTLSVIEYLDTQKNNHELKSNFLKTFKHSPHLFAEAIQQISKSQLDEAGKAHLVMILSRMHEGKSPTDISNALALQKNETSEQLAVRINSEKDEISKLVSALASKNAIFNETLANVDPDLGFPAVADIIAYQEVTINNLLKEMVEKRKIARDAILEEQFDSSQASRILEGMQNLANDNSLLYGQRERLQQDFYFINAIGHTHKISTRPGEAEPKPAIIKDMSKQEIQHLIEHYQQLVRDPSTTSEAKRQGRLVYLALLREVMYRTTGCLPFSTQTISVLNAMQQGGNNISEIQTGQGKTLISALFAAMQHLEGKTVDVCTSNMQLAREGLSETQKFYQYLGVKHAAIDSASEMNDYAIGGINYSDVAQLALFRSRSLIEGGKEPESASLILDEADYTLLDDSTQYRYAVNLDDVGDPLYNPFDFAYKLVNEFINTDDFKNPNATIKDDKENLRKYLVKHAKGAQKDLVRDPEVLSDKQLDMWIDSAAAARELYKQRDKRWTLREETRFDQKISVARLIINDRISPDAQWSNGVQQMLHALVNEEDAIKKGEAPACTLDPEKSAVASTTSKNFIDYYNNKEGVVWGMTGTIGATKEKLEHQEKFDFALTSIPPHQAQRRIDRKPILVDTDVLHQEKIFQEVLRRIRKNDKMPSVIICKDANTSKALAGYIEKQLSKSQKNHPLTLQLYNGINNERTDFSDGKAKKSDIHNESDATSQAGLQGTITISTPMLGRGTDFKPRKVTKEGLEVKHPFGLFVVQTYLDSERTSRQIVGRGGRQGWLGESMTMISKEALQRDLVATDLSAAEISQKQLAARMEDIRLYRNMTAKQQREYSEAYGDVRNVYFAMLIEMLNKIPDICDAQQKRLDDEMLKPEDERDVESIKVPEPVQLRKSILKDWEQYLNNLDNKWKSNLSQPQKPELIDAISSIASFAASEWNQMVQSPHQRMIGDYKVNEGESIKSMVDALEKPLAKAAEAANDPYRRLPETVNVHKAYCNNLHKIDNLDESGFAAAYHSEIDKAFQKLKSIASHERPSSLKWKKEWDKESNYNHKFRMLNEIILQAQQKSHKTVSIRRYQSLENEVIAIIGWMEQFPKSQKQTNELKQMLLQSHINHRKELNKHSPRSLLQHDRNMQITNQNNLYPTSSDYEKLMKSDHAVWSRIKEDSIDSLKKYRKVFFSSQSRKIQTSNLIKHFTDTNEYDLKSTLQAVLDARKQAYQDDAKPSIKKRLFNNKINFGNRFHKLIDDIQARMIANVNNEADLQKIYQHERDDLRLLLNAIDQKLKKDENVRADVQNIKMQLLELSSTADIQKALKALSEKLPNEPSFQEAVLNKISHLNEIDLRLNRLAKSKVKVSVIESPVVDKDIDELSANKDELTVDEDAINALLGDFDSRQDKDDLLDELLDDLLINVFEANADKKSEAPPIQEVLEVKNMPSPSKNRPLPLLPMAKGIVSKPERMFDQILAEIENASIDPLEQKHKAGMIRLLTSLDRRATSKQLNEEQNRLQIKEVLEGYVRDARMPLSIQDLAKSLLSHLMQGDRKSTNIHTLQDGLRETKKDDADSNDQKLEGLGKGP